MTKIMQTAGCDLPVKEIEGQRVVSYKQIAELHQTQEVNLRNNFKNNHSHFIDGVDYFRIKEQSAESKNLLHTRLYFTESGYLMLVKSLTDDLSWKVQRMLVNSYFKGSLAQSGQNQELPVKDPIRKITQYIKTSNWARLKNLSAELSISTGRRVTVNMLLDTAIEKMFGENAEVLAVDFEQVLPTLDERSQQMVYYRRLGLTQIETGLLLGVGEGTIKNREAELRKYGYESPNYRGMRSFGMVQTQPKTRKITNEKVWRLIHEIRNTK